MHTKSHYSDRLEIRHELNDFVSGFNITSAEWLSNNDQADWLHPTECNFYDTINVGKRKHDFLLGRVAAKKAIIQLHENCGPRSISIESGVFRFPVVKGVQNLQVSISHAEKIAVAMAFPEEHPIGIDLERVDDSKLSAIISQCCETEARLISQNGLSADYGYTLLWTIKEALSKILRTGLTINFKLLELSSISREDSFYISTFSNFHQYRAVSCIVGEYVCSVVIPIHSKVDFTQFRKGLEMVINSKD